LQPFAARCVENNQSAGAGAADDLLFTGKTKIVSDMQRNPEGSREQRIWLDLLQPLTRQPVVLIETSKSAGSLALSV